MSRKADALLGGAIGKGLDDNILEACRILAFNYEPGDRISIFGFSRGAYTARSMAGLLRICGIPPRENVDDLHEAMDHYRSRQRDDDPDSPRNMEFRLRFSPFIATSETEANYRRKVEAGLFSTLEIDYIGVWDTVGALGLPGHWALAPILNGRYAFHDLRLSRMVKSARHAIAIDERRRHYPPSVWSNLDERNGKLLGADAVVQGRKDADAAEQLPYQQRWFCGDHGSVGGGGDILGLSSITLEWIAEGARRTGLRIDPKRDGGASLTGRPENRTRIWRDAAATIDPLAPTVNKSGPPPLTTRLLARTAKDREGPEHFSDLAPSVIERWKRDGFYRPRTLDRLKSELTSAD